MQKLHEISCKRISYVYRHRPKARDLRTFEKYVEYVESYNNDLTEEDVRILTVVGKRLLFPEDDFQAGGDPGQDYERAKEHEGLGVEQRREVLVSFLIRDYFSWNLKGPIKYALSKVLGKWKLAKLGQVKEGELKIDFIYLRPLNPGEVYWEEEDMVLSEETISYLRRFDQVLAEALNSGYYMDNRY